MARKYKLTNDVFVSQYFTKLSKGGESMTDTKGKRCQVCGKYTKNLKTEENKYLGITFYYCEDCFKKLKKVDTDNLNKSYEYDKNQLPIV